MQRRRGTEKVEDGTDVDKAADEAITSPTTPTYRLFSMANVQSQLPQYITPQAFDSHSASLLDHPAQDYFAFSPSTQSIGSSGASYGYTAVPEPDWPGSSYISEATSSAPFTAYGPLSGYEFATPHGMAETVPAPCDHELFSLISGDACTDTAGSVSGPTSPPTSPEALYTGQPVESSFGRPDYIPRSPESKSFRGTPQMPKHGRAPLSPSVPRSRLASLDFDGDNVADCGAGSRIQLRTAFRKAKPKRRASHSSTVSGKKSGQEEDEEDSLTPEERRARHSHNIVEKQYRNRLNAQFVRLLAVLPTEQQNKSSGDDSAFSEAPIAEEKRVSKAEVLDLATRRIRSLEEEGRRLEEENSQLIGNVDAMTNTVRSRRLGNKE